jgi:hypothetical protein
MGDIDRLQYLFAKTADKQPRLDVTKDLAVPLPQLSCELTLALQIFDWQQSKYLPEQHHAQIVLAHCNAAAGSIESTYIDKFTAGNSPRKFKLRQETASHVRVYENTRALPNAYLCHEFKKAIDEKSALHLLQEPSFKPDTDAILEEPTSFTIAPAKPGQNESVVFHRDTCNKITIDVDTPVPSLLVLTETFYPGWRAMLNHDNSSSECKIMRTNDVFQSVPVPAGKSTVTFEFQPSNFALGVILFLIAALSTLGLFIKTILSRKN